MKDKWIPALFIFVGMVEFAIGLSFILFPDRIFALSGIAPIQAVEYVQFPALLIMVFGLMMFNIARDPARNLNLILYVCLFKAAFISVVFYNWFTRGLPLLWIAFSFFDVAYLAGFILTYRVIRLHSAENSLK